MNAAHPSQRSVVFARPRLLFSVALALSAFVCRADDMPAPSQKAAAAPSATCASTGTCAAAMAPPTRPVASRVRPVEFSAESAQRHIAPLSSRDLPDFEFHDSGDLVRRLADMRSLPVMTLWQTRRTQIYLGVDQRGLAGLHFRQRGPGELTTLWRSHVDAPVQVDVRTATQAPRSLAP